MIDFDKLVVAPGQNTFARPITLNPLKSLPGEPAYAARAVFTTRHIDVQGEDGVIFSDQITSISIRLSEYPAPPLAQDHVTIAGLGEFMIVNIQKDGQGAASLSLRKIVP